MRNSNNIEIDHHNCSDENWDFIYDCISNESKYLRFINKYKWKPQKARQVLSNALKTELVMTGFVSDWKHFFELRTPGSVHHDARALAIPLEVDRKSVV